jgi:hypothetical protein
MDFEQLLRKYLSGAITEPELEHFQALLDRVPEYNAELRQTLEIRSLLHDDALTLTPPTDLSEHIRIAVSSSFAADAIVEQEEQARRRRVFYPFRLSLSAVVATCIVVGVALSPSLPKSAQMGSSKNVAALRVSPAATNADHAPAIADASSTRSMAAAVKNGVHRAAPSSRGTKHDATPVDASQDILASGAWMLGHEVPSRAAQSPASEQGATSIAQNADGANGTSESSMTRRANLASLLERDPAELLKHDFSRPSYNPAFDSSTHRQIEPARLDAKPGEAIAMNSGEGRRLTIGVTLGAGQVAETSTPTVLMQNTYYLSFSLGGYDRIGIEMGASAFQQESQSNDGFGGKPSNNNNDLLSSIAPRGGSASGTPVGLTGSPDDFYLGKRTTEQRSGLAESPSNHYLAKRNLNNPTVNEAPTTTPRSSSQTDDVKKAPPPTEQQITYGAIFYDRRIQLGRSWDVCGRVTFGGADNAVMGNVRAYAAFTPSGKNITLTMGVGGAGLYNLTTKASSNGGVRGSVNYGIYYGIETGF